MAFTERAYHQYTNPNTGTVDRVEIHEEGYSGSVTQLKGQAPYAIEFEHRETTGTQREYLSIFENQIVMGVLNLSVWVTSASIQTLINNIADATTKNFKAVWKRDGTTVWQGYKHGRIVDYPEKDPSVTPYIAKIQFRDFEILKGLDYPLEDNRQKIITTFSDIFNQLGFSESIKTHTSWQCEGTTVSDDFLNRVYHDTYALRKYANDEDGYSNDQNISYYDALLRTSDPMLVVYQWKGFNIFQISALKDATDVHYSVYNSSGTQTTFPTGSDRSYTLSNSSSNQPSVKSTTNNISYPALKRAIYEFQHRSGSSQVEFPIADQSESPYFRSPVDFDSQDFVVVNDPFTGNGDEYIVFEGNYYANNDVQDANFSFCIGSYIIYKTSSGYFWTNDVTDLQNGYERFVSGGVNTSTGEITSSGSTPNNIDNGTPIRLHTDGGLPDGLVAGQTYYVIDYDDSGTITFKLSESYGGSAVVPADGGSGDHYIYDTRLFYPVEDYPIITGYRVANISFQTPNIPDGAEGDIEIILFKNVTDSGWYSMDVFIENPTQAGESIEYRLIQDNDYSESLRLPDSYYGDGPYAYSRSSYRTSTTLGDITTGWRRRGATTYIPYSRLKLNEVLDYQRIRQLKKTFEINGEIEPDKVAVYETDPFMYVGGRYNGRWQLIGVKVEENTDG